MPYEQLVEIELNSWLEIPIAYEKAIVRVQEIFSQNEATAHLNDNIWDGEIILQTIKFESNFRRTQQIAVFKVIVHGS